MAAAFFNRAYEVIISRGIKSLPMLKCSSERWVWAPQSLSAGTFTSPRLSVSWRKRLGVGLEFAGADTDAVARPAAVTGVEGDVSGRSIISTPGSVTWLMGRAFGLSWHGMTLRYDLLRDVLHAEGVAFID